MAPVADEFSWRLSRDLLVREKFDDGEPGLEGQYCELVWKIWSEIVLHHDDLALNVATAVFA